MPCVMATGPGFLECVTVIAHVPVQIANVTVIDGTQGCRLSQTEWNNSTFCSHQTRQMNSIVPAAKCYLDYPLTTSVNKQSTEISSVTNAQSDRFFCPLGLKIGSGVLSQALSHSAMVAELLAPANYYSLSKT